jgi:DNA polymerase-4
MLRWPRTILHLDMDAFFASVEQMDNPELRGKPLLVGHAGPRGVVTTASYEARPFGCRSAMPMVTARRLCPHAIVVPVRGARYREVSDQVFRILDDFSPLIEPLSIDEAFLDLTGAEHLFGDGAAAAAKLKARVKAEVGITASVGVAQCKYLAKLGSDMKKPDGLTVIAPEDVDRLLPPLPVTRLWGVGKMTAGRLETASIRTIGDFRRAPHAVLQGILGSDAQRLMQLAHGIDDRPVVSDCEAKSIGHEQTFEVDVANVDEVRAVLLELTEQVAARLRRHKLKCRGLSLKIRYGEFKTISRSATLEQATDLTADLWKRAEGLFAAWAREFQPVRLIGITAERLQAGGGQLPLFAEPGRQRQQQLDAITDQINARFGKRSIRRGGV